MRRASRFSRSSAGALLALALAGAGCDSAAMRSAAPPQGVAVQVVPPSASVGPGGSVQFASAISGTTDTRVSWQVLEGSPQGGTVTVAGGYTAPATTGTFHVVATSVADPAKSAAASVAVTLPPPVISSFTATPGTIAPGSPSTLAWLVAGAASLSIDQGIGAVTGTSRSVSPAATTTYTLTASNAGGSATASATVTVTSAAVPVIASFTASPSSIAAGASSTLSWSVTGATSISLDQGIGAVAGTSRSVSPAATTTYTLTATNASGSTTASATVTVSGGGTAVTFPLQAAAGGRYLVDQAGAPFRIHGDSAWSLIANLTAAEVDTYLADRRARGFNALLVNLLEHKFAIQAPRNRAGDWPFTAHAAGSYDFSTPSEPYFAFADAAIDKAAAAGMAVFLSVMYTGNGGGDEGWWTELTNATNTRQKCYQYGLFVGGRWKNRGNVIWVLSGDFAPPAGSEGEARLLQIFQGIRDAGATQLAVAHLGPTSTSSDWAAFRSSLGLNGVYPGGTPTYAYSGSRAAWNRTPVVPAFLFEPGYEEEGWAEPGTPAAVRRYAWWAQLSSSAGAFYGHRDVWPYQTASWNVGYPFGARNWPLSLGRPGAVSMQHMNALLASLPWHELVPSGLSGMKTLVTAGAGSGNGQVAAAANPAGTLLLAYRPTGASGSFTVDMSALSGAATARWWDPTSGQFTAAGSGLANAGTQAFTPPAGTNAGGDLDWLLVLTVP